MSLAFKWLYITQVSDTPHLRAHAWRTAINHTHYPTGNSIGLSVPPHRIIITIVLLFMYYVIMLPSSLSPTPTLLLTSSPVIRLLKQVPSPEKQIPGQDFEVRRYDPTPPV